MTREEALKVIKVIEKRFITLDNEERQALIVAIKALEQESCENAISRQAALDAMYELCGEGSLKDNPWRDNPHIDAVTDAIDNLPSVNPQPKMGRWIKWGNRVKCDQCALTNKYSKPFCPNCGAKMQEVEE